MPMFRMVSITRSMIRIDRQKEFSRNRPVPSRREIFPSADTEPRTLSASSIHDQCPKQRGAADKNAKMLGEHHPFVDQAFQRLRRLSDREQRVVQAGLDGSQRDIQSRSDFRLSHLIDKPHQQDFAMRVRQSAERLRVNSSRFAESDNGGSGINDSVSCLSLTDRSRFRRAASEKFLTAGYRNVVSAAVSSKPGNLRTKYANVSCSTSSASSWCPVNRIASRMTQSRWR